MTTESTQTSAWALDNTHSELTFRVRHMMIANVKGEFQNFSINVNGSDIFNASLNVAIDAASINTNNGDRDAHLRNPDFFDVENHKEITFTSTSFNQKSSDEYVLTGNLTIKGISKEISLNVEFGGTNTDPWGNERVGFSFSGAINRKDWGLNWNAALETGGVLVSEEVKIAGEVQFVKQS